MKLIDEKEVEEAAERDCSVFDEGVLKRVADRHFESGIDFAEQKLLPLMVEFAEWCNERYLLYLDSRTWHPWKVEGNDHFTTEQLLEQFLKNRTK